MTSAARLVRSAISRPGSGAFQQAEIWWLIRRCGARRSHLHPLPVGQHVGSRCRRRRGEGARRRGSSRSSCPSEGGARGTELSNYVASHDPPASAVPRGPFGRRVFAARPGARGEPVLGERLVDLAVVVALVEASAEAPTTGGRSPSRSRHSTGSRCAAGRRRHPSRGGRRPAGCGGPAGGASAAAATARSPPGARPAAARRARSCPRGAARRPPQPYPLAVSVSRIR
jgi:hypothetical protein